jgi:hypothetical protein
MAPESDVRAQSAAGSGVVAGAGALSDGAALCGAVLAGADAPTPTGDGLVALEHAPKTSTAMIAKTGQRR